MKEDILIINLLRFLAALGVLSVHSFSVLISTEYIPTMFSFLLPIVHYGYLGVPLFFIISGFVIAFSSEEKTFREFISARFIRLFPVFWLCVSITSIFIFFIHKEEIVSWGRYFANLTMIPSLFGDYPFIEGVYWSLESELKFYFIIAVILLIKPIFSISLRKMSLILSIPLLYYTLYYNPYHSSLLQETLGATFYFFSEGFAQYFLAGIVFYEIFKNNKNYYLYLVLIIYYVVAVLQAFDFAYPEDNPVVVMFYITVFFGLFLSISLKKIPNASFSFFGNEYKKILITLGAITYPLYLLHSNVIYLLATTFRGNEIPAYIATPLLIFILISLILLVNSFDKYCRVLWKKY